MVTSFITGVCALKTDSFLSGGVCGPTIVLITDFFSQQFGGAVVRASGVVGWEVVRGGRRDPSWLFIYIIFILVVFFS